MQRQFWLERANTNNFGKNPVININKEIGKKRKRMTKPTDGGDKESKGSSKKPRKSRSSKKNSTSVTNVTSVKPSKKKGSAEKGALNKDPPQKPGGKKEESILEVSPQKCSLDEYLKALLSCENTHEFKSLSELIQVVEEEVQKKEKSRSYYIPRDLDKVIPMLPVLKRADQLVGMKKAKDSFVNLAMKLAQSFYNAGMLNVCLYGEPGLGKSTLALLIAELFYAVGLLPKTEHNQDEKFILGTRSTLISGYLGQTAMKTQAVIDRCCTEGKMLLLDEADQFGNDQKRSDQYAKEFINTLNQNMTLKEKKGKLFVIVSGYEQKTKDCFFAQNEGLFRRFKFFFRLEPYSAMELRHIFFQKMAEAAEETKHPWRVFKKRETATEEWFEKHRETFIYHGGDMESLFDFVQLSHARRVFRLHSFYKCKISQEDMDQAYDMMVSTRKKNGQEKEPLTMSQLAMYT